MVLRVFVWWVAVGLCWVMGFRFAFLSAVMGFCEWDLIDCLISMGLVVHELAVLY